MKPVQSSVPELAGDLLPSFVVKGDAAPGESFQAALALALQGVGPIVPAVPQARIPQPVAALAKPAEQPSSVEPAIEVKPVAMVSPAPFIESRPIRPEPVVPPAEVASAPAVAKAAAPPAETKAKAAIEEAGPSEAVSTPTPPPAEVTAIIARSLVPGVSAREQGDAHSEGDAAPEPGLRAQAPESSRAVKPAAMPSRVRQAPAEPREPSRQVEPAESPAPDPRIESRPAARAEPVPVIQRVRVLIEEVNVEAKAPVAAPPVEDRKLQPDVEAVERIAESPASAPRPEGLPPPSWQAARESAAGSSDAPAQLRRADEAPENPGSMDRVTLHLPDDAGGGRIQIAVRGDVVHARIVTADEAGTREMETGLDELRGALNRQGFQEAHVRVESRPASDVAWMPASAAREAAGAGDSRPQDSERQDRQGRDQRQPEESRSDQRRQQADGRSHQRSRRERER